MLGRSMREGAGVLSAIRERFGRRGLVMPEINRRQALVPDDALIVPNANGAAPGLCIADGTRVVLLLPGSPREMRPMLEASPVAHVTPRWGTGVTRLRSIIVSGRSESWVDEHAAPIYLPWVTADIPCHHDESRQPRRRGTAPLVTRSQRRAARAATSRCRRTSGRRAG